MSSTENRPPLGQLLRANRELEAIRLAQEEKRLLEEARAKQQQLLTKVGAFLDQAFDQFAENLVNGREPDVVVIGRGSCYPEVASGLALFQWSLPRSGRWQDGGHGIWSMKGGLPGVWEAFVARCENEGLTPVWRNQHDFVGIESWWELTVDVLEAETESVTLRGPSCSLDSRPPLWKRRTTGFRHD